MSITALLAREKDYVIRLRRHFHKHPELSFKEEKTSARIQEELSAMGVPFITVGDYNVIATIEGTRNDRMVALRADMDALPVQEETGHAFASANPGVMHACGHDGHVAMMLGVAKVLRELRGDLHGTVKLCFQQAEEVGGGAREILAELAKFPVKSCAAVHLWADIDSGKISVDPGFRMAAADALEITVTGVGCHGAHPSHGVDPVITSAALLMNLAALISRENNPLYPAVMTFGKIHGGEMGNIIPETVTVTGSLRTSNRGQRKKLKQAAERVAAGTAGTYGATVQVRWPSGAPAVLNDPECSEIARKAVIKVAGENALISFAGLMASENYGEYLETYPGVMAFVGVRNEECDAVYPQHHPKFAMDEEALIRGTGFLAQYGLDFFTREK